MLYHSAGLTRCIFLSALQSLVLDEAFNISSLLLVSLVFCYFSTTRKVRVYVLSIKNQILLFWRRKEAKAQSTCLTLAGSASWQKVVAPELPLVGYFLFDFN